MPSLQADLELQIESALANLGELDSKFEESAATFGEALANAISTATEGGALNVDTTAAQESLGQVEAQSIAAGSALSEAGQEGQAALQEIADSAGEASSSLGEVGASASSAGDGVGQLEGGTAALTGAMAAARGEGKGVTEGLVGMGAVSHGTAGAVLAGAAALGEFFVSGVRAESAANRVSIAFGAEAESIKELNIGGLTGNMDHLAESVGTTTAQLDNGLAKLGQFGKTAGFSTEQTDQFTQQVVALSLRAVALNPALGSVDEVIQRVQRGLATGGRFAQQFYLSLSRQDILQRAIEMFGGTAQSLTQTEKAAAGASLAVEGLGDKLGTDFAQGADTADNKLKALKAAVENAFEKAGTGLVDSLIALLSAAVPVAEAFIGVLGPALQVVAGGLEALGPLLPAIVGGFIAMKVAGLIAPLLTAASQGFAFLAVTAPIAGEAVQAAAVEMEDAAIAVEAASGPIGWIAAIVGAAAIGFGLFGGSASDASTDLDKLGKSSDEAFSKLARGLPSVESLGKGAEADYDSVLKLGRTLDDLGKLSETNTGAAERLAAALVAEGVITQDVADKLINKGIKAQKDSAEATLANAAAVEGLSDAQREEQFITEVATAAAKRADSVHQAAVTTYEALVSSGREQSVSLQEQSTAYAEATQNATDYQASLNVLNSTHLSLAQAEQQTFSQELSLQSALKDSKGAIDLNTEAGNKAYAAILQRVQGEQSLEVAMRAGGATSTEVTAQQALFRQALVDTLTTMKVAPEQIAPLLQKLGIDLPAAAQQGADGFDQAIGTVPAAMKSAADQALEKVAPGAWDLPGRMSEIGYSSGSNLDTAMAYGITANQSIPAEAAQAMVREIVRAIKNAGSPTEHLFYDAAFSWMGASADGMADGGAQVVAEAQSIARQAAQVPQVVGGASAASVGGPASAPGEPAIGMLTGAGQTTQIGPFHITGVTDPQEAAVATAREMSINQRYSGVTGAGS